MIPVTVIGGYLGAGKTTLINRLLRGDHGRRLAVLVNDFGAVDIDADLIEAHDGGTISLSNGCVCCTIADALGEALDRVLAMAPPPDRIVIEASGVADPAKIAHYGEGWPGLRLDAVVTVADAVDVRVRARDKFVGRLVRQQLRAGDLIVVSKTDLLDERTRREVEHWLKQTAPGARCAAVDGADLFAALLSESKRISAPSAGSDHDALFTSFSFGSARPFDRARLLTVLDDCTSSIWRIKGRLQLQDDPDHAYVLHQVGRRRQLGPAGKWREGGRGNRLVAIGIAGQFDEAGLERQLAAALAPSA